MVDLIVLASVVFAFGIVSRRLEGTVLTAPMVFVFAGIVLGPVGLGLVGFQLDSHTVLLLGEIALALVLFTDASRIDLSALRQNEGLPLRLLGVGMPLTIALGTAVQRLCLLALALISWGLADLIGGNGFIAAFVGGLALRPTMDRGGERLMHFTEAEGQLLNLSVFFVFGVLVVGLMESLSLEVVLYALLSLTLIHMLPVAVCLLGTRLHAVSVLFAGWFGPRGLASIVLGLIVVGEAPLLAGREQLELAVALTVLLSVILHGFTAAPLSAAYARRIEVMSPNAPENEGVGEAPTRDTKEVGKIQISRPEDTRPPTKPGKGAADNSGG